MNNICIKRAKCDTLYMIAVDSWAECTADKGLVLTAFISSILKKNVFTAIQAQKREDEVNHVLKTPEIIYNYTYWSSQNQVNEK